MEQFLPRSHRRNLSHVDDGDLAQLLAHGQQLSDVHDEPLAHELAGLARVSLPLASHAAELVPRLGSDAVRAASQVDSIRAQNFQGPIRVVDHLAGRLSGESLRGVSNEVKKNSKNFSLMGQNFFF